MLIEGLDYAHIGGEEYNPLNRKYKLLRNYTFFFRTTTVTAPAGFAWDGPTGVPYVDTINAAWLEPSLVHDYMYDRQGVVEGRAFSRQEVDENFFIDLRSRGVAAIYVFIMRHLLDKTFQKVWDDTTDSPTKMRKYMVPFILLGFAAAAAATTGLLIYAPTIIGAILTIL